MRASGACGLAIAAAMLTLACSNHIRFVEFETKNLSADVKELRYQVDEAPEMIEGPKIELNYYREELIESRIDLTLTKVEEFTPYGPARELYEVPLGLVSIPLTLGFNVIGVILPGYVSRSAVNKYTDWTFAAANPFLNVESTKRVGRREVDVVTRTAEVRENLVQKPLANWPVEIHFDNDEAVRMETDEEGRISFHLLEVGTSSLSAPPRKLTLSVGSHKTPGDPLRLEFYVDRDLSRRVYEASKLIPVVNSPLVSSSRLSRAVYALDQIGFKEYSLRMEDQIYERFASNEAFLSRFREILDKLCKGELQLGSPSWPVVVPPDEKPDAGPPLEN
jgi:hypothetical protein